MVVVVPMKVVTKMSEQLFCTLPGRECPLEKDYRCKKIVGECEYAASGYWLIVNFHDSLSSEENRGGKGMKMGMELLGVTMVHPLSPPSNREIE